jgi:Tol biopolymer transport system component
MATPAWSPSGTNVVFRDGPYNHYDIYRVSVSPAASPVNLTMNGLHNSQPDYSPDGTKIAFTSRTIPHLGETDRVYVMNVDGTGRALLLPGFSHTFEPTWSASGSRILFNNGRYAIASVASDGSDYELIHSASEEVRAPCWSPDESEVLYWQGGDLWIIELSSGGRRRVTDVGSVLYIGTDWFGSSILFSAKWTRGVPVDE